MIEEKLVTPPIRAALMEENGRDAKTPSRDYWLYWNALTLRANQNAAEIDQLETRAAELDSALDALNEGTADLLRSGTHAARIAAAPDPLNALWVENDRNHIVYQAQRVAGTQAWVYVTGTMYGTLSPDTRPGDLGANDAGFEFAAAAAAGMGAFRYRWSGSAWIETTEGVQVEPRRGAVMTLTTASQPVPGTAITVSRAGRYLATGCFDFIYGGAGDAGALLLGGIGSLSGLVAVMQVQGSLATRFTVFQQWAVTLGVGQVVQLTAFKTSGTSGSQIGDQTTLSLLWLGP